MCSFTIKRFEDVKKREYYSHTNKAWNNSEINKPDKIGYLMDHISNLGPKTYSEWESYFHNKIANKEQIEILSEKFKYFVLSDKSIFRYFDYSSLTKKDYCEMVECRLIYETWFGYCAEKLSCSCLLDRLKSHGHIVTAKHLPAKEDKEYAVDFLFYSNEKLLCGIQVKPISYFKSKAPVIMDAKKQNEKRNKDFVRKYNVPTEYAYYAKTKQEKYGVYRNGVLERIESLLSSPSFSS